MKRFLRKNLKARKKFYLIDYLNSFAEINHLSDKSVKDNLFLQFRASLRSAILNHEELLNFMIYNLDLQKYSTEQEKQYQDFLINREDILPKYTILKSFIENDMLLSKCLVLESISERGLIYRIKYNKFFYPKLTIDILLDIYNSEEEIFNSKTFMLEGINLLEAYKSVLDILRHEITLLNKNRKWPHNTKMRELKALRAIIKLYMYNVHEAKLNEIVDILNKIGLLHNAPQMRARAAEILGLIRQEESITTLVKILKDKNELVKIKAIKSIVHLADKTNNNALLVPSSTSNPNENTTYRLKTEKEFALNISEEILTDFGYLLLQDSSEAVRVEMATALSKFKEVSVVRFFLELLTNSSSLSYTLRLTAVKSLAELKTPDSFEIFLKLAFDSTQELELRVESIVAIARLNLPQSTELFILFIIEQIEKIPFTNSNEINLTKSYRKVLSGLFFLKKEILPHIINLLEKEKVKPFLSPLLLVIFIEFIEFNRDVTLLKYLIFLLNYDDYRIRIAFVKAWANNKQLKYSIDYTEITEMLLVVIKSDRDTRVQIAAIYSLANLASLSVLNSLEEIWFDVGTSMDEKVQKYLQAKLYFLKSQLIS